MSIFILRAYEHIKNRAVRLGILCAFVVTFIGLPAAGQYLGTNAFADLDLISYLGDSIDEAAVSMEEARYQAYLAKTNQIYALEEEDQMVMLAEEITEDESAEPLWDVEMMFKNVFAPTK